MVRGAGLAILGRAFVVFQVRGQRSLCKRTLLPGSAIRPWQSNSVLGLGIRCTKALGQRSLCERTLLLGSRILRSPSNPALGILPRAFEATHDATGIV